MQFSVILATALAAPALVMGQAQTAKVVNSCDFPVYVQSQPNNGGAPGPVRTLAPNGGTYSEAFRAGGSSIRAGRSKALTAPLALGYTPSAGRVYYDMGSQFGNPFITFRNTLEPANDACVSRNCAPNNEGCYSNGQHLHIENCKATSLTMELCA